MAVGSTVQSKLNYALNQAHVLADAPTTATDEWTFGEDEQTAEDRTQEWLDWLSSEILFGQAVWKGFYSGLYSVSKKGMVPKPDADCLGQWIVEDIAELREFRSKLFSDYWNVTMAEYEVAWDSTGDLLFKTFESCHFKMVMEDVNAYCAIETEDPNYVAPSPYESSSDDAAPEK